MQTFSISKERTINFYNRISGEIEFTLPKSIMPCNKVILIVAILLFPLNLFHGSVISINQRHQETIVSKNGLIVHWSYDEGEGDIIFDESKNDFDLLRVWCNKAKCSAPSWVRGKIGYAMKFDGKDDSFVVADDNRFDMRMGSMSFSFWINQGKSSENISQRAKTIIDKITWRKDIPINYKIDFPSTHLIRITLGDGMEKVQKSLNIPNLYNGNWHYFAIVIDRGRGELRVYHNGSTASLVSDISFLTGDAKNNRRLGISAFPGEPFQGSLDELRIYKRALIQEEINTLWKQGST